MTNIYDMHDVDATDFVPLPLYSAALDEIHALRGVLAYEGLVVYEHGTYKTFPKSRRGILSEQVERMRQAAIGKSASAYAGVARWARQSALSKAGSNGLTRSSFEAELDEHTQRRAAAMSTLLTATFSAKEKV